MTERTKQRMRTRTGKELARERVQDALDVIGEYLWDIRQQGLALGIENGQVSIHAKQYGADCHLKDAYSRSWGFVLYITSTIPDD